MGIWKVDNVVKDFRLADEEKRYKRQIVSSTLLLIALAVGLIALATWILSLEVI